MFKEDFFRGEPLCKIGDCEFWGKQIITPELAKEILQTNGKNRKLNASRYLLYARQMGARRWKNTADGITISFDKNGNLANGQHRLQAVIASNISLEVFVCKNGETMAGALELPFDTGYLRSTSVITGNRITFEAPIKYLIRAFYYPKIQVITADDIDSFVKNLSKDEKEVLDFLSSITYTGFSAPGKAGCFFYIVASGKKEETLNLVKVCTRQGALSEKEAKIKTYFDTHKPLSRTANENRLNEFVSCYALFEGRKVTEKLKEELVEQAKAWMKRML
jgi:hypothetical protein